MKNLYIFNINPDVVLQRMRISKLDRYANDWSTDWTFSDMTVIPILYTYVVSNSNTWTLEQLKTHLVNERKAKGVSIPPGKNESDIEKRANKLVLDFCRELHTFGLLSSCRGLSYVKYEKVYDVSKNIDYSASLISASDDRIDYEKLGIQASMRANWTKNRFDTWKRKRRDVRIDNQPFKGPLFYLTNKDIPALICPKTGTWLFSDDHVDALMEHIKSKLGSKMDVDKIAINNRMNAAY